MNSLVDALFVYCYATDRNGEKSQEIHGYRVRPFYHPPLSWDRDPVRVPKRLRSLILGNEDDLSVLLLMGSFIPENAAIGALSRRANIPYVVTPGDALNPALFVGTKGRKKSAYERLFERRLLNGAFALRLYSEAQFNHLTRRGYRDSGRFFIAKEGVDWEKVMEEGGLSDREPPNQNRSTPAFGFLGRLNVYQKGLDILLAAWSLYKQQGGSGTLRIAGPPSRKDLKVLESIRDDLGLDEVELCPPMYGPQKYEFLRSLTCLVHPSRHEGIPRVVREAFAIGIPVIVTDNTNLHDVVTEHGAGLVVSTEATDLAAGMLTLAARHSQLDQYRRGARAAAHSLHWDDIARTVVDEITVRLNGS